ncbi:MAG: DsbA family protein [Alphaproteobacteria bacterium]|nr:DsbA family protein [Alphaproteobacteria bacterium]
MTRFLIFTASVFVVVAGFFLISGAASNTGEQQLPTQTAAQEPAVGAVQIDVQAALADRILGDVNAPIRISEHASLTCGHCAHFHKETFKEIKTNYIDTGKAYIVFQDFPLNAPAIHATMVARCLKSEQYVPFVQALFENQEQWAFDAGYLSYLKGRAAEFGMNEETFKACLANTELQNGIVAKVHAAQAQWKIDSTPSFVIDNSQVLNGARPYAEFAKAIDEALAKIETKSTSSPSSEASAEANE